MGFDEFDEEYEGQLELFPEPKEMFAVSKIFARARKQMTAEEYKTFAYALTNVKWKEAMPNSIEMDKKALAKILNIDPNPKYLSHNLYRALKDISVHSRVEFKDEDKELYVNGTVISTLILNQRNKAILDFNPRYTKLFSELTTDYITMWSEDIFNMTSERSITFYEHLRAHSDTTTQCQKGFGVKALKEMFNLPKEGKGSYMRKQGGFDRTNFEKRIIDPICEDLAKCKMIQLVVQPDGKYYEKVKEGKKVKGYRFYWNVSDRPRIATANEVKEIRENVAKDPKLLKVAKDITTGKKKPKKAPKKNTFNNFEQNTYDFDELEKLLTENLTEDEKG